MDAYKWYQQLAKPSWAPPSSVFGPVWSVLYIIIFASFGYVFARVATRELPWIVAVPFAINLIANFAFSPLQFVLRNNLLAAIDIVVVLITLIWAMIAIWPHMRWVAFINIPYLVWVSFATILQINITLLNAK